MKEKDNDNIAKSFISKRLMLRDLEPVEKHHIGNMMRDYYVKYFEEVVGRMMYNLSESEIINGKKEINLAINIYNAINSKVIMN